MTVLRDKGGLWSPVVTRVEHKGRPAVLKDYRRKNLFTRRFLAPRLVRREFELLRQLEGIRGIPRAYAILDRSALVLEYVEGRTFSKFHAGELPDPVFHRLAALVGEIHDRGVVHLDLRQKKNILVTSDGVPYLIDFAGAVRRSGLARVVWERLVSVDEGALLKFKLRNFPHLVTDSDREAYRKFLRLRRLWLFTPRGRHSR